MVRDPHIPSRERALFPPNTSRDAVRDSRMRAALRVIADGSLKIFLGKTVKFRSVVSDLRNRGLLLVGREGKQEPWIGFSWRPYRRRGAGPSAPPTSTRGSRSNSAARFSASVARADCLSSHILCRASEPWLRPGARSSCASGPRPEGPSAASDAYRRAAGSTSTGRDATPSSNSSPLMAPWAKTHLLKLWLAHLWTYTYKATALCFLINCNRSCPTSAFCSGLPSVKGRAPLASARAGAAPPLILVAIPDASLGHRRGPSGFRPQHQVDICGNRQVLKPSASRKGEFTAENVERLQSTRSSPRTGNTSRPSKDWARS